MSFVNPYFIVGDKEEEATTWGTTFTSTVGTSVTEATTFPTTTTSTTASTPTSNPTLICLCPTNLLPDESISKDNNGGSEDLFWMLLSLMAPVLIGLFHGFVSSAYERMVRNKLRDEENNETSKWFYRIWIENWGFPSPFHKMVLYEIQ